MTLPEESVRHQGDACMPCIRCGTVYPPHLMEWAFRQRRTGLRASCFRSRERTCRACERIARDRRKGADRWAMKARDAIRRHAARLGIDRNELITVYGWDPQRLAHDAAHQYQNGCNYCFKPYAEMGHGLADITLDVQDRDRPPYYCTNTKWCCNNCNRKKGVMSPEEFEAHRQISDVWTRTKNEPPGEQGLLF